MEEEKKIKLTVEAKGLTQTFEGPVEDAVKFILNFLAKAYPAFHYASKLLYTPDLSALIETLTGYIKITEDGGFIFLRQPDSTDQLIGAMLLASHIAGKMGLREKETLTMDEIIQHSDKAPKTIRNTLAYMVKTNLVERVSKGEYKATVKGVKWMEDVLKGVKSPQAGLKEG
ncbi:MAG: hypothetical protein QXO32_06085 [Candidatus Bathyarchaeia archaeon]